jgi:glycosyltransferase involved in cell wall biosynthesis
MRALYVSHTGMTEPLGQSQVVPYVRGLARAGWRIEIVGFEPASAEPAAISRVRDELAADGIAYSFTRRSPSHALAVKLGESSLAFVRLAARALARRPRIVHARSYLAGAVAQAAAALAPRARFLFDCRGLLGDEYADTAHWSRASFRYRLVKRFERHLFGGAAAVVTLTERLRRWLREEAHLVRAETPVEVIPCCVDTQRFRGNPAMRAATRARLQAGDRFVVAYAGTLGSYYCDEELAQLFAALRRRRPSLLAVFTRSAAEGLRAALCRAAVPPDDVRIDAVLPSDMPAALAGADAAVSLVRPWFSKIASSPTKVAEYLAMGLPVVMNRGVGDLDELLDQEDVTIDAGRLEPADLARAAERLAALVPSDLVRTGARRLAEERFCVERVGVARYRALYERLAA